MSTNENSVIHYIDAKTGERWKYIWTLEGDRKRMLHHLFEGNWSCDCNRQLDILRVQVANNTLSEDEALEIDPPCGDQNRYVIERIETHDEEEIPLPVSTFNQCQPELLVNLQRYL